MRQNGQKTSSELVSEAFNHLNAMKRAQTIQLMEKEAGNFKEVNYHKVKENEYLGKLEFTLRAIQKQLRTEAEKQPKA